MTEEEIWAGDLLGRKADADFLCSFLEGRLAEREERGETSSYVLNLDAGWGVGKTYFLERFAQQLAFRKYPVAKVNAWRDDHADEPLLAVMNAIDEAIGSKIGKNKTVRKLLAQAKQSAGAVAIAAVQGAFTFWTRKLIGDGLDAVVDAWEESGEKLDVATTETLDESQEAAAKEVEDLIDHKAAALLAGFRASQRSIEGFRTNLAKLLASMKKAGHQVPLFVLVDELDRCRPAYAISLLERIKHLFNINHVVFVVATDTKQLTHAFSAVYGEKFDSRRYLFRFFDRSYHFEEPSNLEFISSLVQSRGLDLEKISLPHSSKLEKFLNDACSHFALSLRDIEQCYDILRSVITVWDKPVPAELMVLFPLVIGQQQAVNPSLDESFIDELTKQASARSPRRKGWVINFGPQRGEEAKDAVTVFKKFAEMSTKPLYELGGDGGARTRMAAWIVQRLQEEFHKLHRNTFTAGQPLPSIILNYPRMVRSAGRLVRDS